LRVLFVTPECYPLIKTGGLADVAGALSLAMGGLGCEVRVLLPAYPQVLEVLGKTKTVAQLPRLFGASGRLLSGRTADGLEVLALDAPRHFERPGNPYLGPDGKDWPDNAFRFAALSWAGSQLGLGRLGSWTPDLVHIHDWQAGLTPAYMKFARGSQPPTVLTIHNIAFQGLFPRNLLAKLRLPEASFTMDGLEYHGKIGFLKAALQYADLLTTVSPTYAREIQTPEFGMGLDGLLRQRSNVLHGIVNGIDEAVWDPAGDPDIEAPYSARRLKAKAANKAALQNRFKLAPDPNAPLFCVISRLTQQKGLDLLVEVLPDLVAMGGQLALLGSGDGSLEAAYRAAARAHPGRVGVEIGYDEPLSHQLQAGADGIIIPSRFEPCGLTQLYGLRYGTLPIVARVGGLADTVIDANVAALHDGVATGIQFSPVTAEALRFALLRAFQIFADPVVLGRLRRRAMSRSVGWSGPAEAYLALYQGLLDDPGASPKPAEVAS
jgi:starch synthase